MGRPPQFAAGPRAGSGSRSRRRRKQKNANRNDSDGDKNGPAADPHASHEASS
jgi:hypothetical protein